MIDSEFWRNKRVFLTGSTGFKGSWLSIWLSELGAIVKSIALPPPTSPSLFKMASVVQDAGWIEGDIRDLRLLKKALMDAEPDIVFHLAAQPLVRKSYLDPVGTYEVNVMGSVNLLEAVRSIPSVKAVVMVTTDKCYENREWIWGYREDEAMGGYDPYSSSKGCTELVTSAYRRSFFNPSEYGKTHFTAIATARAGNVIGGGDFAEDRLIPDVVRALQSGQPVIIRNPLAIRPWQHVLEPLSGYLLLAQRLFTQGVEYAEAWNFGPKDDDAKTVEWIVKSLCERWPQSSGYKVDGVHQPHEAKYLKLDISKAQQRLGWRPSWSLQRSLHEIVAWYNDESNKRAICLSQIKSYSESINSTMI